MKIETVVRGVTAATVAAAMAVGASVVTLRAAGDRSETLIYAVYNGQNTASETFKTMRSAQG